jgi:hypothetical protein
MSASTVWLGCGVLRPELEELLRLGKIRGELRLLDSMLHMNPLKLESTLSDAIERLYPEGGRVVLVYGDCCPRMLDLVARRRVGRVNAINCAQMLVGRDHYRELMREQAFMLLPEWTPRWEEIFRIELGLTKDVARDLMGDNRGSLVYLDTGLAPVPRQALADCAAYTGLPLRVERVSLESLLKILLEAQSSAPLQKSEGE